MMNTVSSTVRGLGEIALRVEDLNKMQKFYEEVIGLSLMQRFPNSAFFKIAQGFEGHTQILALFDRAGTPNKFTQPKEKQLDNYTNQQPYTGIDAKKTTLDHIAFAISVKDFASEKKRLEQCGLEVNLSEHAWVHWRSLYVRDPEGNLVEFVCYDDTVR